MPEDVVTTVQIAAVVPTDLAEAVRVKAAAAERSVAAEIRVALRAWTQTDERAA